MLWAFAITSIALFMTTLDNLVVTTALPVIRRDLHASLAGLEWMVNAYTLTFAVLLLTGAALGDRFGRRRLFAIGLGIFTGGSALAALAGSANELIAARIFLTERGVEKHVTSIFQKLRLPVTADTHRRVLAVVAFLQS